MHKHSASNLQVLSVAGGSGANSPADTHIWEKRGKGHTKGKHAKL